VNNAGSMRILGIETSCDETGAAVFEDGRVASNVVLSQSIHSDFGGVVPEVASRAHIQAIVPIVRSALAEAGAALDSIDGVAVTTGPGLIGSLIVGVAFAKSLCLALDKPLIGVDHIESHIAATYITRGETSEPFICLVVSGGHTHLFLVEPDLSQRLLGSTLDDAAGEAFDKVARMLGLKYPGGPEIEQAAIEGDPGAIDFPRPVRLKAYEFSFSGLKTAVRYFIDRHQGEISPPLRADIAASFQAAATDVLIEKTVKAALDHRLGTVSAVGGVASNAALRRGLSRKGEASGLKVLLPPASLCTDNAAIVAAVGYRRMREGKISGLSISPYSTRRDVA
jgi:N6-L-threonylcarbamoyladenine synthase